jgi:tungstate transport system permease protein
MIAGLDREFLAIVGLSLRVSLTATILAFLVGVPIATLLAIRPFRGHHGILLVANAFQGLPPVVVGLCVYLLLSRSGPLGPFGLLFTPSGMVLAQFLLVLPIVIALTHRLVQAQWQEVGDALTIDGAPFHIAMREMVAMGRQGFATIFLTAFGRAIAEVGAIMIVGGNIRGHTRTMTTAIALETSKGDLPLALALGLILVSLTLLIGALALTIGRQRLR